MKDTYSVYVPNHSYESKDFTAWFDNLDGSDYLKVLAMMETISLEGVITTSKKLPTPGLYEKKWRSVLRVYFCVTDDTIKGKRTFLMHGSGKKDQSSKIGICTTFITSNKLNVDLTDLRIKK